ncbi:hypothetical protein SKAU_G00399490 [Synaphobranchus kaupii]|uniref:Uncharacterized protein n=1 Tax=Synaphobranchus kaupii TaxID=118154 RepID=A0A9Q1E8T4_SYNKA|nr:hypothetical protein SKAU_G00399490 [Synaphobranchus kaupii]
MAFHDSLTSIYIMAAKAVTFSFSINGVYENTQQGPSITRNTTLLYNVYWTKCKQKSTTEECSVACRSVSQSHVYSLKGALCRIFNLENIIK